MLITLRVEKFSKSLSLKEIIYFFDPIRWVFPPYCTIRWLTICEFSLSWVASNPFQTIYGFPRKRAYCSSPFFEMTSLQSKNRGSFSPTSNILNYSVLVILYHTFSQQCTAFLRLGLLKFSWTLTFEKKLTRLKGIQLNKNLGAKLFKTSRSNYKENNNGFCVYS